MKNAGSTMLLAAALAALSAGGWSSPGSEGEIEDGFNVLSSREGLESGDSGTEEVSPSEVTLVGIMKTDGTVRQQDNSIELTVSDDPAADGCAYWDWVVDQADIAGFGGAARSITFVHDDPGDTKKMKGKMALAGFDTADWDNDGSFTIQLKDPVSGSTMRMADVQLSLRALVNGFTIIDGQSHSPATVGTEGINGAGHAGFTFHVYSADISLAGVTGPSLSLDAIGRVQSYSFPGTSWNQEGDFVVSVQDGTRPAEQWATISGVQLAVRQLVGNGVTIVDGQSYQPGVADTEGMNAAGVNGFVFTAPSADISLAGVTGPTLTFDAMGRVYSYSFPGTSWNQEGDFTLIARDGERPASTVTERPLRLRRITPDPVSIDYTGEAGNEPISVYGDATTTWSWGAGVFAGIDSTLTFGTGNSNATAISWGAGGLDATGDTGTVTFDIAPADGSAPSSTVQLDVEVTAVAHELSVNRYGTGTGTVTSSPVGIDCGLVCSYLFPIGQTVTLTGTPDESCLLMQWSPAECTDTGPCDVVMDASKVVSATFDLCDIVLDDMTIWGAESFTACGSITLDTGFVVENTAHVSVRAATRVVLRNGIRIVKGATFTVGVDPGLGP